MNILKNNYDAIEKLIFDEAIRIEAIDIQTEFDTMLIILNTKAVLHQKISNYQKLKQATTFDLKNFVFTGNGIGIHWPTIDEDLSLKGFLRDELLNIVKKNITA